MRTVKTLVSVPETKRDRMTEVQTRMMIMLLLLDKEETLVPATKLEEELLKLFHEDVVKSFFVQVMIKRLLLTPDTFVYSPLTLMMAMAVTPNVGTAVMWAYTIFDETRRAPLTLTRLIDLFPMGFPTDEGYHEVWDSQKGYLQNPPEKVDNILDTNIWSA